MMMFIVLLLLACFQGLSAIQWTSAYQNTTKICPGHNLTLGWDYRLEPGETLQFIKWSLSSGSGQTLSIIATYMFGYFNSVPPYDNRLTRLSNGKAVLANVTSADSGTYTTRVYTKQTTGSLSATLRHLVVSVADPSIYSGRHLSLKMDQAVADLHEGLRVRLTCGPLAWRGEPAVDVVWTTPSGAQRNSTGYENGYFYLLLDNLVVTGVYACGLPANAIPALCLGSGDPLTGQDTLQVDSFAVRLVLLEANNFRLTQQLPQMTQRVQQLERENITLTQQLQDVKRDNINLTQQLQDVNLKLTLRLQQAERDNINLTQQLEDLSQQLQDVKGDPTQQLQQVRTEQDRCRDTSSSRVGFHAILNSRAVLSDTSPIKFTRIVYNEGGAYNKGTGHFTAPVDGTYFFVFTTSGYQSGDYGTSFLQVGNDKVAWALSRYSDYPDPATGHAVLHLEKGAKVWLMYWAPYEKFDGESLFSAFLIRPDW